MKKSALVLVLGAMTLSSCVSIFHSHEYVAHYGLLASASTKGLTTYYNCKSCGKYFDSRHREVSGPNVEKERYKKAIGSSGSVMVLGYDFEITFPNGYSQFDTVTGEISGTIKNGKSPYGTLVKEINSFIGDINNLYGDYVRYSVAYAVFNNDDYYNASTRAITSYRKGWQFWHQMEQDIANSKYRNDYFEGQTDEEIEEYLSGTDVEGMKLENELISQMDSILSEYKLGTNTDAGDVFSRFKTVSKRYADLKGVDNYLTYLFSHDYGRDYGSDKIEVEKDLFLEYVCPVWTYLSDKKDEMVSGLSLNEKSEYNHLLYDSFVNTLDVVGGFANKLGGSYKTNYEGFLKEGVYYISNIPNENVTAYSWAIDGKDMMFFGCGSYQNTNTFIHEFGHHNAGILGSDGSYDILETHSQGSEAMLSAYLLKNGNKAQQAYALNTLESLLSGCAATLATSYVEYKAYTVGGDVTTDDLQSYWNDFFNECGSDASWLLNNTYWKYGLINSPGYYLSYAVSAISSLYLASVGLKDFSKASNMYSKIYDIPRTKVTDNEIYEYAEFPKPFTTTSVNGLLDAFKEVLD